MELIERNIMIIVGEMEFQSSAIKEHYTPNVLGFDECIARIKEFVDANECGLAYELLVSMLEGGQFTISGSAAVKLLEIGLLFGFKTEISADKIFDRR